MIRSRLILGVVAFGSTSACFFHKQPRAFTPPAPLAVKTSREVAILPPPPAIKGDPSVLIPPQVDERLPDAGESPRRPTRRAVQPSAPKPQTGAGEAAPETPAPKLGQMYTPDQLREYNRTLDESLGNVKRILAIAEKKNLTPELKEMATRIETFQKQAEQAREQDLATAVILAKRADLLAKDLLERLP